MEFEIAKRIRSADSRFQPRRPDVPAKLAGLATGQLEPVFVESSEKEARVLGYEGRDGICSRCARSARRIGEARFRTVGCRSRYPRNRILSRRYEAPVVVRRPLEPAAARGAWVDLQTGNSGGTRVFGVFGRPGIAEEETRRKTDRGKSAARGTRRSALWRSGGGAEGKGGS